MEFANNKRNGNGNRNQQPSQTARVTENLTVAVWRAEDKEGGTRMHFKIARVNPRNPEATYSTLRPEHLLEVPEYVATLASAFAQHPDLAKEVREELRLLARDLTTLIERKSRNGVDTEEPDGGRVLNI